MDLKGDVRIKIVRSWMDTVQMRMETCIDWVRENLAYICLAVFTALTLSIAVGVILLLLLGEDW